MRHMPSFFTQLYASMCVQLPIQHAQQQDLAYLVTHASCHAETTSINLDNHILQTGQGSVTGACPGQLTNICCTDSSSSKVPDHQVLFSQCTISHQLCLRMASVISTAAGTCPCQSHLHVKPHMCGMPPIPWRYIPSTAAWARQQR